MEEKRLGVARYWEQNWYCFWFKPLNINLYISQTFLLMLYCHVHAGMGIVLSDHLFLNELYRVDSTHEHVLYIWMLWSLIMKL